MVFGMMSKISGLVAAGALAVALVGGAHAATVTVHNQSTQGVGNMADVFAPTYAANTPAGASWGADDPTVANPPLSVNRNYKSPFLNTTLATTQSYFAADIRLDDNGNGTEGKATLTYSTVQSAFKMLWGSVDKANKIVFKLAGVTAFSYTGAELGVLLGLVPPPTSPPGSFEEVVLLSFGGFGAGFDSIEFSSNDRPAFEFALPAAPAPIPVPAAGLMLLTALGGIAILRRRKTV